MNRQEYVKNIQALRRDVVSAISDRDYARLETQIDRLLKYMPVGRELLLAKAELLAKKDGDIDACNCLINSTFDERIIEPLLQDVFSIKRRIFPDDSLEYNVASFSFDLYSENDVTKYFTKVNEMEERCISEDFQNVENLLALAEAYFGVRDDIMYFILLCLYCDMSKCRGKLEKMAECLLVKERGFDGLSNYNNFGYLRERCYNEKADVYIVIDRDDGFQTKRKILVKALSLLGKIPILLKPQKLGAQISFGEAMERSLVDAKLIWNGMIIEVPYYWDENKKTFCDLMPHLISHISNQADQESPVLVFSDEETMNALHSEQILGKHMQRLSVMKPDQFSYCMAYAWSGDYLKYSSDLYGFDVHEHINKEASCDFSIVIPVRNSADTLVYTIDTCLGIDYGGSYEIVISDNSDVENNTVYNAVKKYKDERIKYYRTNGSLELAKSFEFAFLQAEGDFIFSIGADDGVMPWCLSSLKRVLSALPDCDVVVWERGLYIWPSVRGFGTNCLYYKNRDSHDCKCGYVNYPTLLELAGDVQAYLYKLPLLYINSGFRRSYLKKLLEETGRLWDGPCQDTYMGVVGIAIDAKIAYSEEFLSIAGQSGYSIGLNSQIDSRAKVDRLIENSRARIIPLCKQGGQYVYRRKEYDYCLVHGADDAPFFWPLYRLMDMGVMDIKEPVSLRTQMLVKSINMLSKDDADLERKLERLKWTYRDLDGCSQVIESLKVTLCKPCRDNVIERGSDGGEDDFDYAYNKETGDVKVNVRKYKLENIKMAVDFVVKNELGI